MLLDTFDVLEAHNAPSKYQVAEQAIDLLLQTPVTTIPEVAGNSRIVPELRVTLFGTKMPDGKTDYSDDVMWELDEILAEVTRPNGLAQEVLGDMGASYVLCSAQVKRKMNGPTHPPVIVSKQGRFVSDDDEIVNQYRWMPAVKRWSNATARINTMMANDMQRIPQLGTHRPKVIIRAHDVLNAELPAPKKNGSS